MLLTYESFAFAAFMHGVRNCEVVIKRQALHPSAGKTKVTLVG